jgi:hypothetical protein
MQVQCPVVVHAHERYGDQAVYHGHGKNRSEDRPRHRALRIRDLRGETAHLVVANIAEEARRSTAENARHSAERNANITYIHAYIHTYIHTYRS